jgi:hypothetical protein
MNAEWTTVLDGKAVQLSPSCRPTVGDGDDGAATARG